MAHALPHLVFGGRVEDSLGTDFADYDDLHVVGIYPNYAKALEAWRGASQGRVDDAAYKYVIVHLHRLMEPDEGTGAP